MFSTSEKKYTLNPLKEKNANYSSNYLWHILSLLQWHLFFSFLVSTHATFAHYTMVCYGRFVCNHEEIPYFIVPFPKTYNFFCAWELHFLLNDFCIVKTMHNFTTVAIFQFYYSANSFTVGLLAGTKWICASANFMHKLPDTSQKVLNDKIMLILLTQFRHGDIYAVWM